MYTVKIEISYENYPSYHKNYDMKTISVEQVKALETFINLIFDAATRNV